MSLKTKIILFSTVFLWASAFVGIRAGLHDYSPEGLALLRFIIASFCMAIIYFRLPKRSDINFKDRFALMGIGLLGVGVYSIALNYGEMSVPSGMASFFISQSPLLTTLFAIIFLGEKLTVFRALGFITSVSGVCLIAFGEKGGFRWDPNLLYIFLATLISGCYSVLQKPFLKKYNPIEAATYIIWGGTLFLMIYYPHLGTDMSHASWKASLAVIYLGVFPAAIGYLGWTYALSQVPAARAVSFLYFMPFGATLLGWVWLGEVPMLMSIIGGLLAILGVWFVNQSYRPKQA